MKIGSVTVCDECGAAYTPHTMDCSHWRELPPMDVIEWKAITIAPDEREAVIPLPQYQHAMIDLESEKFGKFSFGGFEFPVLRTITFPPASEDTIKRVRHFFNAAILGQREDESDEAVRQRLIRDLGKQLTDNRDDDPGDEPS